MRSSHRRSLNVGVTAVSIGTVNGIRLAEVFLTAGRKDVHLRSPVRIAGLVVIRRHRSHADNPVVITGELQSVLTGVARSEHDESALHGARLHSVLIHAGVVDEVIEPRLQVGSEVRRGDLPAAGSNDRSVVGRIGKHVPVGNRLPVVRRPSDSHYPHAVAVTRTARDSADSLAVVVHGGNRTGDMRPVVSGHYLAAVVIRSEVPSVQVVHVPLSSSSTPSVPFISASFIHMLAARSGWSYCTPISTTATMTSGRPVFISHPLNRLMSAPSTAFSSEPSL